MKIINVGHYIQRGYNCRTYSQVPDEEFKPRYERLKVLRPDMMYQCNLTKTVDRSILTKEIMNNVWNDLLAVERSIGIKQNDIHDDFGGSYRMYHDHILIELLGEEGMEQLSQLRLSDDIIVKNNTIENIMSSLDNMKIGK